MTEPQAGAPSVLATHAIDPSQQEISHPPKSYTYYHAGPLFTIAELHTNALLSQAIQRCSSGKFIPVLPQDLEQRDLSPHSIRDEDLRALLSCDMAMFTYDGTELDAGTVVEYMVAKMADIPAVILRTDIRGAGDQGGTGDPWNLMSSNWPRTVGVAVDAMVGYKTSLQRAQAGAEGSLGRTVGEYLIEEVSQKVVDAFEKVLKEPPRMPKEARESVYQWLALMPGFKNGGDQHNLELFTKLCKEKQSRVQEEVEEHLETLYGLKVIFDSIDSRFPIPHRKGQGGQPQMMHEQRERYEDPSEGRHRLYARREAQKLSKKIEAYRYAWYKVP